jgi:hypothetical protein
MISFSAKIPTATEILITFNTHCNLPISVNMSSFYEYDRAPSTCPVSQTMKKDTVTISIPSDYPPLEDELDFRIPFHFSKGVQAKQEIEY